MDSLIYAIGGSEGGGEQLRLKSAERYDPATNVWLRLPDMNERRSDAGKLLFLDTINSGITKLRPLTWWLVILKGNNGSR